MATTELLAPPKRRPGKRRRSQKPELANERVDAPSRVETKEIYEWFDPDQLHWKNIDWITLIFMVAIHVGCLAAPFFFTWSVGLGRGHLLVDVERRRLPGIPQIPHAQIL